jgi:hypothetical protein
VKEKRFKVAELVVKKEKTGFHLRNLLLRKKKPVSSCGTCCYERKSRFPLAVLVVMKEKTGFHLRNLLL